MVLRPFKALSYVVWHIVLPVVFQHLKNDLCHMYQCLFPLFNNAKIGIIWELSN